MYVPNSTPKLANPGVYYAEFDGDAVEKESKFDAEKRYFQIPLLLTPKAGSGPVKFLWFCQPDSDVLSDALLAIGGRRNAGGGVDAPAHPEGRRFEVVLIKGTRKDGKEKREIASAGPIEGQPHPADDGPPVCPDPDPDTDVPF